jgi:hypothetical protein
MKKGIWLFGLMFLLVCAPQIASAGFMDKLNAAAQQINQKAQGMPNANRPATGPRQVDQDEDHPLNLEDHYHGSCEGKRSATCMDYMELMDQCMAPLNGYRAKLLADRIEKKLKSEKLNDKQRKNLEEDMAGLREAEKNKSNDPTIAGEKNSQRYLMDISEEDQVYVNAEYNKFNAKIMNKCEGADHMGVGHRTEFSKGNEISGDEAVAQFRKEKAEEKAKWQKPNDCMAKVTGARYAVMAEMMEKKMQKLNPQGKERADWEEDIAAVKAVAEGGGMAMPQVKDAANPYRPITRLSSPDEMMALNTEYSKKSQEMIAECSGPAKSSTPVGRKLKTSGLVDHSKSPANPDAVKAPTKLNTKKVQGGALGAGDLTYMKGYSHCFDPLKGHLAKVTADKLEAKLKSSSGISAQKRKEWEEDIAAWREAERNGADKPNPPDPNNPYRWYDYVSNQERQQINKEHLDFNNKIVKECGDKPSGL